MRISERRFIVTYCNSVGSVQSEGTDQDYGILKRKGQVCLFETQKAAVGAANKLAKVVGPQSFIFVSEVLLGGWTDYERNLVSDFIAPRP